MASNERLNDPNYRYGGWLSSPLPGEEVVISGISGRLPESNNVYEFMDHLFNKRDMVNSDGRRWAVDHPEIPQRTAKIFGIDKYDAGYFGVHYRQADNMDPMMRKIMEVAVEAIFDAGVNPRELEGTKTGVFMSACFSDMQNNTIFSLEDPQKFVGTGYIRSFLAHRVSYLLKLKGPSYVADTACSSSMSSLDSALKYIRSGQCDNALVGSSHLLLHPGSNLQFFRLGVLSKDGVCKVFDEEANGYARGESIACIFLQKAKNSKRIYAQVVNVKSNSDGFKDQGITYPSATAQKVLMTEIYEESNLDYSNICFIEAHGTGTAAGDPQEVEAIDDAIAKKREKQLLVGSVKCSIGHTEPSSGLCSIIKILIAMETGLIAPNIHLKNIKKGMVGFEKKRMKVVTELTELKDEEAIIGINNFGFGGSNVHTVLRRFKKRKVCSSLPGDDLPRLVCVSGRTQEAVLRLLGETYKRNMNVEYIGLLNQTYKRSVRDHLYRGYAIVTKKGVLKTSVKFFGGHESSSLYIYFGSFVQNFQVLGLYLMEFPVFKELVIRINRILLDQTFEETLENGTTTKHKILGSLCLQIAIIDFLKILDINPAAVYGDAFGKLLQEYYYDINSLEETVLAAAKISQLSSVNDLHSSIKKQYQNKISSRNAIILNISDSYLGNKDVLPVEGGEVTFLNTLGRLYEEGHSLQIHKLYPELQYPVSRATLMISPLIGWDYRKHWYTYKFKDFSDIEKDHYEYIITYLSDEYKFIAGHVIDGRNLFPATQYLYLVWETFARRTRGALPEVVPVTFTDCKFVRAISMPQTGFLLLLVTIQKGSGRFEVLEKNSLLVTGTIQHWCNISGPSNFEPLVMDDIRETRIMEKNDIYKQLHLRGYNYSGIFKGVEKCNIDASVGLVRWEHNWAAFMDKMLQMKILQIDTNLLMVPVGIKKLTINPLKHLEQVQKLNPEKPVLPVYAYKECNVIKSGEIEICGLHAKSISRKRQRLDPILEKNIFVPFSGASLNLQEVVRVNTQLILEYSLLNHFKAVECIDELTCEPLLPLVCQVLDDLPVVTPDLTIMTKMPLQEYPGVKIDTVTFTSENNLILVVGNKLLQRPSFLKQILPSLNKNGFVLTREDLKVVPQLGQEFDLVTKYATPTEQLLLLKLHQEIPIKFIEISSTTFDWIPQLQASLNEEGNVIAYGTNQQLEGILGFVNCLRREPNGQKLRCFFMMDEAPPFNPKDHFYLDQIKKTIPINIWKHHSWGSYRHLLLDQVSEIECDHVYASITTTGDISTLRWLEGPLTTETSVPEDRCLIAVYCCPVNFKDVMIASGRVNIEAFATVRLDQDCLLGFEFAGRDLSGRRWFGMLNNKSLSSYVLADRNLMWEIPDEWSLEEGASVPVVYATVLYSLFIIAEAKPDSSILIHSATGGVGLAALNICRYYNYDVYVTVGTKEKREYLKTHYPWIPESHISTSRGTDFEEMIKTQTNSKGVDIVLNSLADDKLMASIRCLASAGIFLEIGKFDLSNDTSLNLQLLEKGASYHGIMLDRIFAESKSLKAKIQQMIKDGIRMGYVKPLPKTVFDKKNIEASFRHMMTGRHIGKTILKIREEESDIVVPPKKMQFKAYPRFNCGDRSSYVIIGGLGGVGLELADWLVVRGAKNLLLVSRFGVQNGYQMQRIKIWRSYGIQVQISTKDSTKKQGCVDLIKEAKELGPVDGVFNLAVVLKDALFENQTKENFGSSLAPKAEVTKYLDQVTRELCPELRHFVVFSSVSCGRGNPSQSNYGMANSIMERICEKRKDDGLPAIAIQWGAIGDVGLVAEMQKENKEIVIGGTLQQKISNCFEVLDRLLKQDSPIVSSMVVAEKLNGSYYLDSPVEAVAYILGIKDIKTVSPHATLAELGMDSMMGTETIQVLENEFEIYLTAKDIRSLTFAKLIEIEADRKIAGGQEKKKSVITDLLVQYLPDGSTKHLPTIKLASQAKDSDDAPIVLFFTGIEGVFKPVETLAKQLNAHVIGIQYDYYNPEDNISECARNLEPVVEEYLSKTLPFYFVGYSFGVDVGLELVALLEAKGYRGHLILIDGSPTYLASSAKNLIPYEAEEEFQTTVIFKILSFLMPVDSLLDHKDTFLKYSSFQERIDFAHSLIPVEEVAKIGTDKQLPVTLYKRFKAVINYRYNHDKIRSKVHLFKAKFAMVKEEEDYQLSKLCVEKVEVSTVEGDHATVVQQKELADLINAILTKNVQSF